MEYITLNNGVKMPVLGLGTYLLNSDDAHKRFAAWVPDVDGQK